MKKQIVMVVLMLSLFLVSSLPLASADAIPLTAKELEYLADDSSGMLDGGKDVINIYFSSDVVTHAEFTISYFNTMDDEIVFKPRICAFWEEREHTVKEDYIYYLLPDLSWISLSENECVIPPDHKFDVNVYIDMPTLKAFNLSNGGGFIFLITGETNGENINVVPARKEFLTLYGSPDIVDTVFSFDLLYLLYIGIAIAIISIVLFLKKHLVFEEVEDE